MVLSAWVEMACVQVSVSWVLSWLEGMGYSTAGVLVGAAWALTMQARAKTDRLLVEAVVLFSFGEQG